MKKIFLIILVFSAFFCKAQNLPFYFPAPYDAVKGMYYQPVDSIQLLWKTSPTYATRYYINITNGNTAISVPYSWELDYLAYTTTQINPVMTNSVVTGYDTVYTQIWNAIDGGTGSIVPTTKNTDTGTWYLFPYTVNLIHTCDCIFSR